MYSLGSLCPLSRPFPPFGHRPLSAQLTASKAAIPLRPQYVELRPSAAQRWAESALAGIPGSAALEGRLRRSMTDDDAFPLVLHRPSAGPMLADVARAGISRQQSQSIPSGISASQS